MHGGKRLALWQSQINPKAALEHFGSRQGNLSIRQARDIVQGRHGLVMLAVLQQRLRSEKPQRRRVGGIEQLLQESFIPLADGPQDAGELHPQHRWSVWV